MQELTISQRSLVRDAFNAMAGSVDQDLRERTLRKLETAVIEDVGQEFGKELRDSENDINLAYRQGVAVGRAVQALLNWEENS